MNTTFIYCLKDPQTGKPRYVGKSNNPRKRLSRHCVESQFVKTHKDCWIRGLLLRGTRPILEVLDEVPISQWKFWECEYLRVFRLVGFDLTNLAPGGEGGAVPGRIMSVETRRKIGQTMMGNKRFLGGKMPESAKEKIRQSRLGRKLSPASRKKISDAVQRQSRINGGRYVA